jgi:hypothetical protein
MVTKRPHSKRYLKVPTWVLVQPGQPASLKKHPHWVTSPSGVRPLIVTKLNPRNVIFGLKDPDSVLSLDIYNI